MKSSFLEEVKKSVKKRSFCIEQPNLAKNTMDFCEIFKSDYNPAIIAEIKFSSPSKGKIYPGSLDHVAIASQYLLQGASALSILSEPYYFKGDISYIRDVRSHFSHAHILLKDFILSKEQILEGALSGANAVLLIVAFLGEGLLKELYDYAIFLGLTPVVEVHNYEELHQSLKLSPKVIGINNRNLKTLEINLDTSRQLAPLIPKGCYAICESGIETLEHIREMTDIGFDGFLVGSSLMRHENPGEQLRYLMEREKA